MSDAQREAHKRMMKKLNRTEHRFFSDYSKEIEKDLPIDITIMALHDTGWRRQDIAVELNITLAYVKSVLTRKLKARQDQKRLMKIKNANLLAVR